MNILTNRLLLLMSGLSAGACPQDGAEYKVQTRSMPTQIRFSGSSENVKTKKTLKYLITQLTTFQKQQSSQPFHLVSCFLLFIQSVRGEDDHLHKPYSIKGKEKYQRKAYDELSLYSQTGSRLLKLLLKLIMCFFNYLETITMSQK